MKCKYCGSEIYLEEKYCQNCGILIEDNTIQKTTMTTRNNRSGRYSAHSKEENEYRKKWYLSAPFILALYFLFAPAAIVLTVLRLKDYKKQSKPYRLWSFGLFAFPIACIILGTGFAIRSSKWESEFNKALSEHRYTEASDMLDQQFDGTFTPTAIGYYFQLFNASGDYQNADVLLDKYFASLSDKTELDSGIRAMYEKNINMFSELQKERIREVFAITDAATLEKVKAATKTTESKPEVSLSKEAKPAVLATEHTEIAKQAETSTPKQTDSRQKKAAANARTAVDNYLSKSSSKNLKKVKKQDKNEVFKYSQELVLQYVQQHSGDSDYPTMIGKYTETIQTMLNGAFKETPEWLDTVCSLAATLEEDQNAMDKISNLYPFPISKPESCFEQQYYITQRLENSYSDNIWGSIQKELDSYSSKNMSSWIGYNVEYYPLAGAMPGDDATVIVCDQKNTFPESGVYTILCYQTKSTRQLKDSKGFVSESPVVYMISDPDKMYEDYDEYTSIQLRLYELTEKIAKAVGAN